MSKPRPVSRRRFLRDAGASAATAGAASLLPAGCATGPAAAATIATPPRHRALAVPGVHAYPLEHSITAGATLELCVSASVPYRLSFCRLGRDVDDPAATSASSSATASRPTNSSSTAPPLPR
mgnify:CR=1 FL=1